MYLSEIYIDNFKTLREVRIHFNKELNVFTGKNNAGKTTILEALALWNECFRTLVVKAKKSDSYNNIRQGDYRLGTKNSNYIDHRSITSVRTSRYEDIFYEMKVSYRILISVKLVGEDFELTIPIRIKSANGGNYLISLDNHDDFDFGEFNSKLNLPTPFTAIYASPVAALISDEKFFTHPQVYQQVLSRKSFLVLRNRIAKLKSSVNYSKFESDVSYILFEENSSVTFEVIGDINKDVKVNVNVNFGRQGTAKDISLLGSGTLQIIELMLAIYEDRSDLNIIMLDEPDSHIHRDIQKRLINVLNRNSLKAQVFLTTHNESLIRATKPNSIFHISNSGDGRIELVIRPINYNVPSGLKAGIQPSGKSKVIKALGNSDSLDILDCLEAKKIVFVEGEDDALFIRSIYEKVKNSALDDYVFWSLNGIDTFINCISHYQRFFQVIAGEHNLWSKTISVIDADYMTAGERENLCAQLVEKIELRTFIWAEYTIEGSILSDRSAFCEIVNKVLISQGVVIPLAEIRHKIDIIIGHYCDVFLRKINEDSSLQCKISGQILNRNANWSSSVGISNLFKGGAQNHLTRYQEYARPLLKDGVLTHMVGKDEFSEITLKIFLEFGVSIDCSPLTMFEYLLNFYDGSIRIDAWSRLVEFIDSV